jgi:small subunit ribosomal protein S3
MGQKVHPYGFRLGFNKPWRSRWFSKQGFAGLLQEDLELKEGLRSQLKSAGVSSIEVDRPGNKLRVTIRTSRPGIIIGRKGAEIEKLKTALAKKTKREVFIDIQEVHKPELDAQLVSESIALQLEKRVAFRRAMRKAVDSALRFGCKGIKVRVSGRLNGAEIARSEWYLQGQLPLHTLRADIDYGTTEAHTTYGVIGVKAWLYKGEILEGGKRTPSMDGEPRRNERGPAGRDRDRRPPRRDGDRGPASGPGHMGQGPARIAGEHALGEPVAPVQAAPPELRTSEPRVPRAGGPIMPPLMPPAQPAWKEPKPEVKPPEPKQEVAKQEVDTEPDAKQPEAAPAEPENKE